MFGQLDAVVSWSFDKLLLACKGWIEYFLYGTSAVYWRAHSDIGDMAHSSHCHLRSLDYASHPGLDLTHGDVVHGGLLPPGPLGHHHLQQQQDHYTPHTDTNTGYWLLDEFFSGQNFWHGESLQIICFRRKDETPPSFIIVRLQIENW